MYTTVADQTTDQLGGPLSVLVRQKCDHVRLNALIEQLRGTSGEDQAAVLLRIYRLVFPHAFAEESVLWPVMRRVLLDGGELTLEMEREHQEVNELVSRLEGLDDGSPERADVLGRLTEVLDDDVVDSAVLSAPDALVPALRGTSSALARASHGVELLPIMRSGEDPSTRFVAGQPPFPWVSIVFACASVGLLGAEAIRAVRMAGSPY